MEPVETRGRRKISSWVLVAIVLAVVVLWWLFNIFGARATT